MQPEAIESGALNVSCQINRNDTMRPSRLGPYICFRYSYDPPAAGNDAPSSAHTRPSHIASTAPIIHPSIACGPCMAMMISGSVMNGPTPIMSSTFSRTAPARLTPRIRPVASMWLFSVDATHTLPRNAAPAYYGRQRYQIEWTTNSR